MKKLPPCPKKGWQWVTTGKLVKSYRWWSAQEQKAQIPQRKIGSNILSIYDFGNGPTGYIRKIHSKPPVSTHIPPCPKLGWHWIQGEKVTHRDRFWSAIYRKSQDVTHHDIGKRPDGPNDNGYGPTGYIRQDGGYLATGKADTFHYAALKLDKYLQRAGLGWPIHETEAILRECFVDSDRV